MYRGAGRMCRPRLLISCIQNMTALGTITRHSFTPYELLIV